MLSDSASHLSFFFFNDTATTEIYTLSLHDALPISDADPAFRDALFQFGQAIGVAFQVADDTLDYAAPRETLGKSQGNRSEEHTSELQSRLHLVCRLLLEKKKKKNIQ